MGTAAGIAVISIILLAMHFVIKGFEKIDHDRKHPSTH